MRGEPSKRDNERERRNEDGESDVESEENESGNVSPLPPPPSRKDGNGRLICQLFPHEWLIFAPLPEKTRTRESRNLGTIL